MKPQLFLLALIIATLSVLQEAKTQSANTKYGDFTLFANTTGDYNSAFGEKAFSQQHYRQEQYRQGVQKNTSFKTHISYLNYLPK